ncbi:hypothetical protein LOTGIDRAFT_229828 [Lottia gigantea]|uniref:Uncharacterized protein n=1 Tax=Lottia gigantea TaxID=225164 RepID=V3ZFB6_LOTGI|nr:hypothetical protein LOTGIDRAFT_229828 [Lottia gigantea]ESO82822.1 hypothetical protein LOTGIDRAFT_229828 [Lottia gigantea]
MSMALPNQKVQEIKQLINNHLSQSDIQRHFRNVLDEVVKTEFEGREGHISENELIRKLKERGVVANMMKDIQVDGETNLPKPSGHFLSREKSSNQVKKVNIDPTRRHLYLTIQEGKAFLEHLHTNEVLPGQQVSSYFTLHVHFRTQRFKTKPIPCACEPAFDEGFLLELHKESAGEAGRMADNTAMLSMYDPIHIVLIKTDSTGKTSLVASHYFEWRPVLTSAQSKMKVSIELKGTGIENQVPVGVLVLQMELFPKPPEPLREEVLRAQLELERHRQSDRKRGFLTYSSLWWEEYLQIRDAHKNRIVKIFATDENGNNKPVNSYVKPFRTGRLIETPRQAARFVSLIHKDYPKSLGQDKREQWTCIHSFLCMNRGGIEDHATLLCSLLLGFGLDTYVCIGTSTKGATHAWVMTRSVNGLVTFWESIKGNRYIHEPIDPNGPPMSKQNPSKYPYKTVDCVFNHRKLYANNQSCNNVEVCRFILENESLWKSMSEDAIASVCGPLVQHTWPPLSPSNLDVHFASNDLEDQIKALVTEHRQDQGLTSVWNDEFSYLLTPALASYETERVTGITCNNEEFQDAIQSSMSEDHTLKSYPIQFTHRNPRKIFTHCLNTTFCNEIINCRGDQVRLGVRVRIYSYPESACATWVMLGCIYKSVL